MSGNITVITSGTVKINVSNSANDVISFERKFDKGIKISELKVSHAVLLMRDGSIKTNCF